LPTRRSSDLPITSVQHMTSQLGDSGLAISASNADNLRRIPLARQVPQRQGKQLDLIHNLNGLSMRQGQQLTYPCLQGGQTRADYNADDLLQYLRLQRGIALNQLNPIWKALF